MTTQQYYVYIYHDPETMQPFYVGKGQRNRYKFHLYEAQWYGKRKPARHQNVPKIKRILEIQAKGREPLILKVFRGLHDECLAEERRLVALYGRVPNGPLLNQTDGGDGTEGYHHTAETRALMSQQRRGKPGRKHSEEWKQHLRENNPGIVVRKRVVKLTPDATIIETFESMTAAATSIGWTKNNFGHAVVKDGSLPQNGFFYRYEDSADITPEGIKDAGALLARREAHARGALSGKAVEKVSLEGTVVASFESMKAAQRAHPHLKYHNLDSAARHGRALDNHHWRKSDASLDIS